MFFLESNKPETRTETNKIESIISDFDLTEPLTRVTSFQSPHNEESEDSANAVTSVTCKKQNKEVSQIIEFLVYQVFEKYLLIIYLFLYSFIR